MIEEEHIRFVAAADVTDDCRVEVQLRKSTQTLTASQARSLAAELVRAAGEAERAADELLHVHEPAAFDMLQVHDVQQIIPWPPHPESTYLVSRFTCCCGWNGRVFKDTKDARAEFEEARADATAHQGRAA